MAEESLETTQTQSEKNEFSTITEAADQPSITNEEVKDEHHYQKGWKLSTIAFALCLGTFLIAIDNTIITVAIPKITSQFRSLDEVGWYGSAYLLTLTSFQPSFGKFYKMVDSKLAYLVCIVIFEAGSVLCAAAPSSRSFILGRAIAGIGAAGIFQGGLQIITLCVVLEDRPMYLGIVVSTFGLATCFGPVLGGFFTAHVTWRWCFWINLPVGAFTFILIVLFLDLRKMKVLRRRPTLRTVWSELDPLGSVAIISSVCCLLLALQWGGTKYAWKSATIIGLLIGFALLIIIFGFLQWKLGERATIPLRVLRQRSVIAGSLFLFFLQMTNYIVGFFIPFYFQSAKGVSAVRSGIQFFPLTLPLTVSVVITGAIVAKTGHYVSYMIAGEIIYAVGTGLLTRIKVDTSTAEWAAYLAISGIGLGMGMQLPFTALQVVLSEADIAVGNAITLFLSQLGAAIALTAGQAIFVQGLLNEVPKYTLAVSPQAVVAVGATNLPLLTSDPVVLRKLREVYSVAIDNTLYLGLAACCVAIPFAACMEWKNVKKVAEGRKVEKETERNVKVGEVGEVLVRFGNG